MSRSRRLYLYGAALFGLVASLVSLIMFLWRIGANQVAALLGADAPSGLLATPSLPWLLLFVLAFATWLFHIISANREARPLTMAGAAERAAAERKMYLYGGRLLVIGVLAGQLWLLVRSATLSFLDGGVSGLRAAAGLPVGLVLGAVAAFGYWFYLHQEAKADGDLGQERGGAVAWRRLYTYGAAIAGALLAFVGGAELIRAGIRVLMTPLSGDTGWHVAAAGALAALVIGLPLASFAWRAANRAASFNPPAETNALSRVLVRYDGVFIATLITLVTFGYLIEQIILRAIGRPDGIAGRPLFGLFDWTWALAYLPVAAITWISFASGARMDALWGGEKPRTAAVRRTVRYLLTGASLVAFWYGLTEFTRLILQVFLGADTTTAAAAQWVQRFATSAAFLLVGAPSWWGHWWSQQMRARGEGRDVFAERASGIRRAYLVGIMMAGAAVVVAAAGFALFLALNWRTAAATGGASAAVAGAAAAALVALFWTLAHGLVLRGDTRWLARERATQIETAAAPVVEVAPLVPAAAVVGPGAPAGSAGFAPVVAAATVIAARSDSPVGRQYTRQELAPLAANAGVPIASEPEQVFPMRLPYSLAVIDEGDGAIGVALTRALVGAYRDAVIWTLGLTAEADAAMLAALGEGAEPAPPDALDQVAAILAPSDALLSNALRGEDGAHLAAALESSPARLILLPPRNPRYRWAAAPNWPLERWIENAVIEAGNALEAATAE